MDRDKLLWLAIVMLVAVRTVVSIHRILWPGLQMDETLFVDAATIRIPSPYLPHSLLGIPLMVFPYIGALKSWLYDPVFSVFGTSAATIRIPVVVITSGGLLMLYPAVRDLVNRSVAVLVVAVLCFDNSIFWLTRDDVGPSSLEFFFKCAGLLCAARFARSRRARWVVLLLLTLGLGVFNKLNFIWVVNAAAAVSALVIVRYRRELRTQSRALIIWAAGLAVIYTGFSLYYFGDHIGSVAAPAVHGPLLTYTWPSFELGMRAILSGTWFYGYALAPLEPRNVVVGIVLAMFAIGTVASVLPRTRCLSIAALAIATLLIAGQILVTPQATAGWHYVAVYPFVTVVAGYGVYVLASQLLRRPALVTVALVSVALASVGYSATLIEKSFRAGAREPTNSAWSPQIYALSSYVQQSRATIFTADWGIFNPLFALHPDRRYREIEFDLAALTPVYLQAVRVDLADTPGPRLVITHGPAELVFPESRANLFRAVGKHLHLVAAFRRGGSPVVFDVYQYT